jgi:hypothetical protein
MVSILLNSKQMYLISTYWDIESQVAELKQTSFPSARKSQSILNIYGDASF